MSANRSTGAVPQLARLINPIKQDSDEAAELRRKGGVRAVEAAGVEKARALDLALSTGHSGKAVAKNAKREAEERKEWEAKVAKHEKAMREYQKREALEKAFVESGFKLPYLPPLAHPGCPPAQFVSSAEKHRLENERRAEANKAKMVNYVPSSNSSCSPPVSSGGAGGLLVLERIRKREIAAVAAASAEVVARRKWRLARMGERLLRWVRSIRTRNSPDGPLNIIKVTAFSMVHDEMISKNQRNKWADVLKFCKQLPGRCDLSLIGYRRAAIVGGSVVSDTIHVSNLPGQFNNKEMEGSVLKQLRLLITRAAPHLLRGRGHQVLKNNVAMRNGWSSGFAFFKMASPEIAAAIVEDLRDSGSAITADCYNVDKNGRAVHFGKRTAVIKIQLAESTVRRTPQQQREHEEAIVAERRRLFHESRKAERDAKLAIAAAEKEFKDSFVALPGAPVSLPVAPVMVGPSFRELLQGLAKPAPVVHVAPVDAPVGWHEGQVYDVLSSRDLLARFQGFTDPVDETPVLITRLNVATGWEEEFTLAEVEAAAAAEEAAEAAKVAATKTAKAAAAKAALAPVGGKRGVLSAFFGRA